MAFEYENNFRVQNEDRECEQYALVFWENDDNKDVTFNIIDAAPLSERALRLRFFDYIPARVGNGKTYLFFGRVVEVGGKTAIFYSINLQLYKKMQFTYVITLQPIVLNL